MRRRGPVEGRGPRRRRPPWRVAAQRARGHGVSARCPPRQGQRGQLWRGAL